MSIVESKSADKARRVRRKSLGPDDFRLEAKQVERRAADHLNEHQIVQLRMVRKLNEAGYAADFSSKGATLPLDERIFGILMERVHKQASYVDNFPPEASSADVSPPKTTPPRPSSPFNVVPDEEEAEEKTDVSSDEAREKMDLLWELMTTGEDVSDLRDGVLKHEFATWPLKEFGCGNIAKIRSSIENGIEDYHNDEIAANQWYNAERAKYNAWVARTGVLGTPLDRLALAALSMSFFMKLGESEDRIIALTSVQLDKDGYAASFYAWVFRFLYPKEFTECQDMIEQFPRRFHEWVCSKNKIMNTIRYSLRSPPKVNELVVFSAADEFYNFYRRGRVEDVSSGDQLACIRDLETGKLYRDVAYTNFCALERLEPPKQLVELPAMARRIQVYYKEDYGRDMDFSLYTSPEMVDEENETQIVLDVTRKARPYTLTEQFKSRLNYYYATAQDNECYFLVDRLER